MLKKGKQHVLVFNIEVVSGTVKLLKPGLLEDLWVWMCVWVSLGVWWILWRLDRCKIWLSEWSLKAI